MRKILCLYTLLCCFVPSWAQDIKDQVRLLVEDYVSQNEEANVDIELLYETFYDLYENPVNINAANEEMLYKIPFLTPRQISALLDYIKKYGEVHNIYELQGVYGFDQTLLRKIAPFITFAEVEDDYKQKIYFKHEILLRSTTVVEKQEGYKRPDSMTHYAGSPYSALIKYKGSMSKTFFWHLTAEQDRGEAWFEHADVVDFWSLGLEYQGKGLIKNAIIGDFRMCLGQGLVINNNFGYGKSSQVMDVIQKGAMLKRFTSSSEYALFRGGATHLQWKKFNMVVGISSRLADASLDSIDNEILIRSFPETGLHRTSSEIEKYKAARVSDVITHLDYTHEKLKIGATFAGEHLSNIYKAAERWDNYFMPQYQDYYNVSLDYKWKFRDIMFFGELATDKQNGWAGIQGLLLYPSSRVQMSMVYRNYGKKYFSLYGQAFGEGSKINNEEGLYLGTNILIAKGWSLDWYLDWYRFPWLRYGISRPTTGYDVLFQPNYSPTRNTSMHWRVKYEEKENNKSTNMPLNEIENTQRLELRYHLITKVTDNIALQSRIATTHQLNMDDENGYLIYQDVTAKMLQQKLSMTLRYSLFNTTSYASRIYTFESDVLYLSSIPSFYGKGSRTYLNSSYKLNDIFTFYLKLSYGKNYDGRTMGSGLDAIDADHKTDVHFQVRIKL